ncbi:MAG TPA: rhodanese-like domain-containing protein [Edaphobacter sp.]|nr:rhodanese-like domain-containing protein [Edaphobacter sp.]
MLYPTAVSIMVAAAIAVIGLIWWKLRARRLRRLESYSINADELRTLLEPEPRILLIDVRQPLDLLAHSEMIPGAKRITPKEIVANPSLIPYDTDAVIYCTCEDQKTSREIIQRGLTLGFRRVKLLRGGFSAWKEKGYPVVPYKEVFHLDTAV